MTSPYKIKWRPLIPQMVTWRVLEVKGGNSEYSLGDAAEYLALAAALFGGKVDAAAPTGVDFFLAERRLE